MRTLASYLAARNPDDRGSAAQISCAGRSSILRGMYRPRSWLPVVSALLLFPLYRQISLWAGLGFFLITLVILQLSDAVITGVALTEMMLLNYLLQYFAASFFLYYFPTYHLFDIGREHYPRYLAYAVPACFALYAGTTAGRCLVRRTAAHCFKKSSAAPPAWQSYGLFFLVTGNLIGALIPTVDFPPVVSFCMTMIANLRWVGLFTGVLTGSRRAWLWLAPTLMVELYLAKGGSFHALLLWVTCSIFVLLYRERWKAAVLPFLCTGIITLSVLQNLKLSHRNVTQPLHPSSAQVLAGALPENVENSPSLFSPARLSFIMVRFDQGWIVSRVLRHTPSSTPFARGATIVGELVSAFTLRAFSPGKQRTLSYEVLFVRFTGIRLPEVTTMFLGPPAEMYANFGWYGGLVGMAVFGAVLGSLYGLLERAAAQHPVWWAWGPWVGLLALKSEEALGPIENWLIKSILLMGATILIINILVRLRQRPYAPLSSTPP